MLETRPLFRLSAQAAAPQIVAGGPYGERRFIAVTSGSFSGERISGPVLSGGADCQLIRPDGAVELDVRVTLEADDGAIILMKSLGIRTRRPMSCSASQAARGWTGPNAISGNPCCSRRRTVRTPG